MPSCPDSGSNATDCSPTRSALASSRSRRMPRRDRKKVSQCVCLKRIDIGHCPARSVHVVLMCHVTHVCRVRLPQRRSFFAWVTRVSVLASTASTQDPPCKQILQRLSGCFHEHVTDRQSGTLFFSATASARRSPIIVSDDLLEYKAGTEM